MSSITSYSSYWSHYPVPAPHTGDRGHLASSGHMSLIGHVVTVLLPCQGLLFNNVDILDDKIDRQSFTFYTFPFAKVNIRLNQGCELKCSLSVMLF